MKQIFEEVHAAVVTDIDGNTTYSAKSLIQVPGITETPLRVVYHEFAGVIAGIALNDDNSLAGKFLGYPSGKDNFEIIAATRDGSEQVEEAVAGGVVAKHLENFATRLRLEGFDFNRAYAI